MLPLPVEVGAAIAAYLKIGRPISTNRRLFLRARAPIRGFKSQVAVLSVVRHALIRAEVVELAIQRCASVPACPGERDVAARRFSTRNRPDTGPPQSPDDCNLREG